MGGPGGRWGRAGVTLVQIGRTLGQIGGGRGTWDRWGTQGWTLGDLRQIEGAQE